MIFWVLVNNLARLGLTWPGWLVCQVGQVVFPKLVTDPDGHCLDPDGRKPRCHKVVRTEILVQNGPIEKFTALTATVFVSKSSSGGRWPKGINIGPPNTPEKYFLGGQVVSTAVFWSLDS